jgi:hypothetical protein
LTGKINFSLSLYFCVSNTRRQAYVDAKENLTERRSEKGIKSCDLLTNVDLNIFGCSLIFTLCLEWPNEIVVVLKINTWISPNDNLFENQSLQLPLTATRQPHSSLFTAPYLS